MGKPKTTAIITHKLVKAVGMYWLMSASAVSGRLTKEKVSVAPCATPARATPTAETTPVIATTFLLIKFIVPETFKLPTFFNSKMN